MGALLVRHVSRRVEALRRRCCELMALADETPGPQRQLERLEYLQQSLPTLRWRVIAPLGLVGVLVVAYVVSNVLIRADSASLLGDLTITAVDLDRGAAVEAFERSDLELATFFGAAATLSWSLALMIVSLLPAFSVQRRLIDDQQGLSQLEARGFAALGCRPVQDPEPGIVVHSLMVAAIACIAAGATIGYYSDPPSEREMTGAWAVGAVLIAMAAVAGAGLARRSVLRRPAPLPHRRITSAARSLVWTTNILIFISLVAPE